MIDRKLDAALHEALTGKTVIWTRWLGQRPFSIIQIALKDEPGAVPMTTEPSSVVPTYASTGDGMLRVVAAMQTRGWYWKAAAGFDDRPPLAGFGRPDVVPVDYAARDSSLPRATVLAALAALGRPVAGIEYGGWLGSGLPRGEAT